MNDTTAPGYLAPLDATPPFEDLDLEGVLQPVIVGITGLPDALVVIKGQPIPPSQPDRTITWCAFGITDLAADVNPSVVHDGDADTGLGTSTYSRTERLTVMASFYGPACRATAALLRDGISLGQNRANLRAQGIAFVSCERLTTVPDLQNGQFIRRTDLVLRFARTVSRSFAIRNVVRFQGTLVIDGQSKNGPATLVDDLQTGT